MGDINITTILGRLTRDVEVRYGQSGIAVATFTVAVNRKWKDKNGEAQEETAFVPVVLFGLPAQWASERRKGESVIIVGRLRTDSWEKDGATHSRLVLIAEEVQFVERLRSEVAEGGESNGTSTNPPASKSVSRQKSVPF